MEENDCIPGHFYWVITCYDADSDLPFEEQRKLEPAKYLGNNKWSLLGMEDEAEWPVICIDSEIIPPEEPKLQ